MIEYYDRFVVDLCPDSGSRYVVSDNAGDGVAIAFVNDIEEALDAIHDFLEREKLALELRMITGKTANIDYDKFPKKGSSWKGSWKGLRCKVYFDGDPRETINGRIVRNDIDPPYITIIKLDDGRFALSTECQYRLDFSSP